MSCDQTHMSCAPSIVLMFFGTVLAAIVLTIGTTWARHGGRFKMEYAFAGQELAAAAIASAALSMLYFVYAVLWCLDGGDWAVRIERLSPQLTGSFLLLFLAARLFLYCRNQYRRATNGTVSLSRAIRNSFVGSVSFTTTTMTIEVWSRHL